MNFPQLSPDCKRILQMIKNHGVCTGQQLSGEAGMTADKLVEVIGELTKYDLVSASGGIYSVKDIGHAYFNIKPSNADLTEFVLKT